MEQAMGSKDTRHFTGSAGSEGGVRDGYRPELDSFAQAKYSAALDKDPTSATKGRLARIRRVLRRLLWEF
jgi:hypothetical protein